MKLLLYLGIAIAAVVLFFSGSLPYTLIYDQESLQGVEEMYRLNDYYAP